MTQGRSEEDAAVAESVTVTDNRTGQSVEIPIVDGGVSSSEFSKLLPGIWFYDPAFSVTALCESAITFVDGEAGILEHRGYPIEQLAERSSYLEVAYLLTHGELPTAAQLAAWCAEIAHHESIEEKFVERFVAGFHPGAHDRRSGGHRQRHPRHPRNPRLRRRNPQEYRVRFIAYTYWPAANPEAPHWKLKPPSCPVTSTTSPMKYRPGTLRASIVCDESSPVSTPPAVTSAFS